MTFVTFLKTTKAATLCKTVGTIGLVCLAGGCATGVMPKVISKERIDYNQFISQSQNEQLLLNLVRLHYQDPPLFLELNTVVASYNMGLTANGGATFNPNGTKTGTAGGTVSFGTSPSVNYTPLQGEAFAKRMLTPITPETLVLLSRAGWSIERLMNLCVERINLIQNTPRSTLNTPTPFEELADQLRSLQKGGPSVLDIYIDPSTPAPRMSLATADKLSGSLKEAASALRQKLALGDDSREFRLSTSALRRSQEEISIQGRSLIGTLFYLSQGVETPLAHVKQGLVKIRNSDKDLVRDAVQGGLSPEIMKIRSQGTLPANAFVKVHYRGYWYYIGDEDLDSKTNFSLLTYLFSLQGAQGGGLTPMLTLPVGK